MSLALRGLSTGEPQPLNAADPPTEDRRYHDENCSFMRESSLISIAPS